MLDSRLPRVFGIAGCIAMAAAVVGCQTSHVLIGKARPPITADQVRLYLHPPARYEEVALLDTSSKYSFSITAQGKTNAVVERLKKEAAELGANGILLNGVGDQATGSVGSGFAGATGAGHSAFGVGISSSSTVYVKKGAGLAIYVAPDAVPP